MKKRKLGKTNENLSVIGFGGIVVMNVSQENANDYVAEAVDKGINYFDVAPTYGNAQERLGPALKPYRNSSFLACKTAERDANSAEKELHNSLKLLQTDHIDLYQFHSASTVEDVEKIFAPGGAMETFVKAKEAGLVRYLGFSSHSETAALMMLKKFDFDTILFPISLVCWPNNNFGAKIIQKACERNMGILALKSMSKRPWNENEKHKWGKCWYKPIDEKCEAKEALRFTLSKPVTAAIPPGHELFRMACEQIEVLGNSIDDELIESNKISGSVALFDSP